ncbi:hypothetical protein VTK56DRAFT_2565 [Thermocarpiscus australiensis]
MTAGHMHCGRLSGKRARSLSRTLPASRPPFDVFCLSSTTRAAKNPSSSWPSPPPRSVTTTWASRPSASRSMTRSISASSIRNPRSLTWVLPAIMRVSSAGTTSRQPPVVSAGVDLEQGGVETEGGLLRHDPRESGDVPGAVVALEIGAQTGV